MKIFGLLLMIVFGRILNAAHIEEERSKLGLHGSDDKFATVPVNINTTKLKTPIDGELRKLSEEFLKDGTVHEIKNTGNSRQLKLQTSTHKPIETTAISHSNSLTTTTLRSQNRVKNASERNVGLHSAGSTVSSPANFEITVQSWLKVMTDILLIDTKLMSLKKSQCNEECRNNTKKKLKLERSFLVKKLENFRHTNSSNSNPPIDVFKPKKFANRSKLPLRVD